MLRLLQGDVGSGKTVVALVAAARDRSRPAAASCADRTAGASISIRSRAGGSRRLHVAILTGRERGRERQDILDRLTLGDIDLLIGTTRCSRKTSTSTISPRRGRRTASLWRASALALAQKGEAVDVLR